MDDWRKLLRPQFVILVLFLAFLIVVANTNLVVPAGILTAMTVAVTGWITGESAVDVMKAKNHNA